MALENLKFVVYVSRSKWGKWPGPAFATAARRMAHREAITSALADDGANIFQVLEGTEPAVDRFMAFVLLNRRLVDTRVIHESRRSSRLFAGQPLAYCFAPDWRPRVSTLVAGGSVNRQHVWRLCEQLADRVERGLDDAVPG